ncbi:hypothetical protein MKZ38_004063 [Zalerion maritima]|uniref:RING-type domain-containing protein n=1 Tax=Zalerion maritima TaxID=339359 RepID=A0AAD5RT83_9PEZI|nr:hypothetical protein MKZ38_004063 [Zalerion maritima]
MDNVLRCNSLNCRRPLTDQALVTTCSHIFCLDCANRLGLDPRRDRNVCPACGVILTSPGDYPVNSLNPTEDYKTSVLSGLSPNIIMECTGRAMSFWAYQTTQEMYGSINIAALTLPGLRAYEATGANQEMFRVYQERVAKALTEKYTSLNSYLDKTMADANTEIEQLQNQITMQEKGDLTKQNGELQNAFKEKHRALLQATELYDRLKKKAMMNQMEVAASDAVDSTLNSISQSHGHQDQHIYQNSRQHGGSSDGQYMETGHAGRMPHGRSHLNNHASQGHGTNTKAGLQDWGRPPPQPRVSNISGTPSNHRRGVGPAGGIGLSAVPGLVSGTPRMSQQRDNFFERPANQPRATPNAYGPKVGMSPGVRVSQADANTAFDFRRGGGVGGEKQYKPKLKLDGMDLTYENRGL